MSEKTPVLFIDDEEHIRLANRQTLEISGYEVTDLDSADQAAIYLSPQWPGVVVSDIRMQGISGLEFLQQAQAIDADIPVVLISGHSDIAIAVKAIHDGAYDFIEKPFAAEHLIETVNRARDKRQLTLENRMLKGELEAQNAPGPRIIGRTPAVTHLRKTISQLADAHADILILGETGTGKELIARSLHEHSQRKQRKFVAVNCGAVPENLIESELFGHEAGAFTGANNRRIGKFEDSDGGTLFLDEIESMPMSAQIHLLRVLQERTIERLGSNRLIPLDLRVVAATKLDLKELDEFRDDLYYRLNVVTIQIPPLRERREDIPLLFEHFLLIASSRYHRDIPPLKGNQIRALLTHSWPGNVRELKNTAERYMLLGENFNYDLEKMIHGSESEITLTLAQQVDCFEKSLIIQELTQQKGSIKNTMEVLGLPRKTLYDKMQKYGLDKNHFK
jgi:two-component system C4-dicarboxylate transport response regulator DctD